MSKTGEESSRELGSEPEGSADLKEKHIKDAIDFCKEEELLKGKQDECRIGVAAVYNKTASDDGPLFSCPDVDANCTPWVIGDGKEENGKRRMRNEDDETFDDAMKRIMEAYSPGTINRHPPISISWHYNSNHQDDE